MLSLAKHCSEAEVRSAYLKMAKKYHPDAVIPGLSQGEEEVSDEVRQKVESRFKEISEAYERVQEWVKVRD